MSADGFSPCCCHWSIQRAGRCMLGHREVQGRLLRLVRSDGGALRGAIAGPQQITNPRPSPDGAGRGCFMPCASLCRPLWAVLRCGNIRTLPDDKTALRARKWPLRRFCVLGHVPPCRTWAQKCRLRAVGGHTSSGKMVEGTGIWAGRCRPLKGIKTAPGLTRGGSCDIQDFFAVSQMIRTGRAKINRIIKRCTSSQAPQGGPAPRCTLLRMRSRHGFRKRGGIAGGQRSTGAAPGLRLLSWLARSWLISSILPAGGSEKFNSPFVSPAIGGRFQFNQAFTVKFVVQLPCFCFALGGKFTGSQTRGVLLFHFVLLHHGGRVKYCNRRVRGRYIDILPI